MITNSSEASEEMTHGTVCLTILTDLRTHRL
jgi:hypothetical protein